MRICLITREYAGVTHYTGGIGVRYAQLAPELVRQDVDTHVVTMGQERTAQQKREGVSVHVVHRPPRNHQRFAEELSWGAAVERRVRKLGRFDVCFIPEYQGGGWRLVTRKESGLIITNLTTSLTQILATEGRPRRPPWRPYLRYPIQQRLERRQAEQSDALVAVSQAVLDWTRRLWRIDHLPATVVPNGLDLARVRRLAEFGRLPAGFPDNGDPVIAFSGRLQPLKGVLELMEAMVSVWQQAPATNLVLAGGDNNLLGRSMSAYLRELAGAQAGRVYILGSLPAEQLFPALAASDVVALPSRWESFGNAALEAMALGRAVVLTTGNGFEEICRDDRDGLLVNPRDSQALAGALLRLLSDRTLRERFGEAATSRADDFKISSVASRLIGVFSSLAEGR